MFNASLVFTVTCLIIWNVNVNVFVVGVNECNAGLKTCPDENSVCNDLDENTNETATCTCKTGYTGNETFCEDVDECLTDGTICPNIGSQCENTQGSFLCLCKRDYLSKPNNTCVHKEDCTKMKICHENAECINSSLGDSFNCSCKSGYTGDGKLNCTDVNECLGANDCHENSTCENVPGSYECTCKVKVEKRESCQVSSYCPTQGSQDKCKDDDNDDDDDDNTVIALVSITIVLLILCLIGLIIAIYCIYRMRNAGSLS